MPRRPPIPQLSAETGASLFSNFCAAAGARPGSPRPEGIPERAPGDCCGAAAPTKPCARTRVGCGRGASEGHAGGLQGPGCTRRSSRRLLRVGWTLARLTEATARSRRLLSSSSSRTCQRAAALSEAHRTRNLRASAQQHRAPATKVAGLSNTVMQLWIATPCGHKPIGFLFSALQRIDRVQRSPSVAHLCEAGRIGVGVGVTAGAAGLGGGAGGNGCAAQEHGGRQG